jgi:hypothetical protein
MPFPLEAPAQHSLPPLTNSFEGIEEEDGENYVE